MVDVTASPVVTTYINAVASARGDNDVNEDASVAFVDVAFNVAAIVACVVVVVITASVVAGDIALDAAPL